MASRPPSTAIRRRFLSGHNKDRTRAINKHRLTARDTISTDVDKRATGVVENVHVGRVLFKHVDECCDAVHLCDLLLVLVYGKKGKKGKQHVSGMFHAVFPSFLSLPFILRTRAGKDHEQLHQDARGCGVGGREQHQQGRNKVWLVVVQILGLRVVVEVRVVLHKGRQIGVLLQTREAEGESQRFTEKRAR